MYEIFVSHPFMLQSALFSLFFIVLSYSTRSHWFRKTNGKRLKLPPSLPKLPILGNLHQLGTLPHRNFRTLAKKHGPLMLLHFGSVPALVVSSADAAKEILKTHDLNFANRADSSVNRRMIYNCKDVSVSPYGEYWRQLKSICVLQLLSNKRVQSFHFIREEETEIMVRKIRDSHCGVVDLSGMFVGIANDVVCRSAFGRKYSEGENGKRFLMVLKEFLEVLGSMSVGDFIPWLSWVDWINGFDSRVERVAKEMDYFLETMIQERLKKGQEIAGDNFLDILLGIYMDNNTTGVSIDRDSIKAIILDVFAAGTDTTATVLEWAMTELLRHPAVLKKLQEEVRGILKERQQITDNELQKMHYLKAVIKETLRFHTPIPTLVARVAREDVKIKGYDILSGTMVMVNAWAIGRDPDCWDEPEKFKPERFLNSAIDFKGLDFEFIPFGAGRRGCPGISFAMATDEFVLANIVHKFDWELANGVDGKDLDMSERPGVVIRRATPLLAVATQFVCQ
ncbi:cytochrome P450 71A8-like [Primulina huaijiensis]|uniref:cytochrome P450 71A8-like n=1 Tax=Primulina huaijiensis TaxID=1492673 RepID=UPI003CC6EC0D